MTDVKKGGNMNKERQIKNIQWTINLPMSFPVDWSNELIEFHLNESSWCCDNLIDDLLKYSKGHGCICSICKAKVKNS